MNKLPEMSTIKDIVDYIYDKLVSRYEYTVNLSRDKFDTLIEDYIKSHSGKIQIFGIDGRKKDIHVQITLVDGTIFIHYPRELRSNLTSPTMADISHLGRGYIRETIGIHKVTKQKSTSNVNMTTIQDLVDVIRTNGLCTYDCKLIESGVYYRDMDLLEYCTLGDRRISFDVPNDPVEYNTFIIEIDKDFNVSVKYPYHITDTTVPTYTLRNYITFIDLSPRRRACIESNNLCVTEELGKYVPKVSDLPPMRTLQHLVDVVISKLESGVYYPNYNRVPNPLSQDLMDFLQTDGLLRFKDQGFDRWYEVHCNDNIISIQWRYLLYHNHDRDLIQKAAKLVAEEYPNRTIIEDLSGILIKEDVGIYDPNVV